MKRFDSLKSVFRSGKNIHVITCTDILYCRADGSYSHLYTIHGEQLLLTKNLKATSLEINHPFMLRISQSVLLNLFYVVRILMEEKQVELLNGKRVAYTVQHKILLDKISDLHRNTDSVNK